jgi:hypothetical protein
VSLSRGPLLVLHVVVATVAVLGLLAHLAEREREVNRIKEVARQEHLDTVNMQREIAQQQALLDGIGRRDPYVVELIARDRLQYSGPGEFSPPPLPAIDKIRVSGSK